MNANNYCEYFLFQSEIGFGKMESYTKLDKLGEVKYLRLCAPLT